MIALNLIGTNKNSGTKTFNTNLLKKLSYISQKENLVIYTSKNYLNDIKVKFGKNINFVSKSNIYENFIIRFLWMQLFLPISLKKKNIKILFSSTNYSPILSKILGIKSILFVHTVMPWEYLHLLPGSFLKNYFIKKLMELSIIASDIILVPSKYAKKIILKNFNLKKEKIKVVYLGADHIYELKNSNLKLRRFNYNDDYILSVLSCVKYHNIINLLKAYKLFLIESKSNVKFVLVMTILDFEYFNILKKFIKNNFEKNQIIILPDVKNIYLANLYKNSSIYLYTSYSETFGFTTLEAKYFNVPLVISRTSALREINGTMPMYFYPNNIKQTKQKISYAYKNKIKICKNLKNKKKQLYKFMWNKTLNQILKILKSSAI